MPVNPAYQHKARKTREAAKARTSTCSGTKAATTRIVKPISYKKPKRARLTPEERKEREQVSSSTQRQRRKQLGLCKDCPNNATKG